MPRDGSPRVLICRLSAIGDCMLTVPVLCALRRHFPGAMLGWIVQPQGAALLRDHECLDALIEVPRRWLQSATSIARVRRTLRSMEFDVAIDAQSLAKSAVAAWISGSPRRIGFARPLGREGSHWLHHVNIDSKHAHIVRKQLDLLEPLGIVDPIVEFRMPAFAEERERMRNWLDSAVGPTFLTVNPGATWHSKQWPPARFADVARHMGRRHGLPTVIVWGGPSERILAEFVQSKAHGHAIVAPSTDLRELASLLRMSRLVIASDTGPLHIAAAVGATCVGLHGTTRAEVSRAYGPDHAAIQAYYQATSRRAHRTAPNDAMRAISAERVMETCDILLSSRSARAA